ncbi:MAG: rhomboid family intramembrane serine protease [Bacteroidota bacterium]|nr:rhomboid family intramembrane serine protease [Bacteroidota bacterium]
MNRFGGRLGSTPPVVLNLLIINVLLYFGTSLLARSGVDLINSLALYYPGSDMFRPYQIITHMFMHGSITHLFFNMFALWMFGKALESVWGSGRFFIYYFVTGIGAAILHTSVLWLQMGSVSADAQALINTISPEGFAMFLKENFPAYQSRLSGFITQWMDMPQNSQYVLQAESYIQDLLNLKLNVPTVGASGAVFGVLLAFGMLFPNTRLVLLFPPIPIKAKWFVIAYGLIELFSGISNRAGDNVAHFAHLGGMIFGFILIKYWNKTRRNNFY